MGIGLEPKRQGLWAISKFHITFLVRGSERCNFKEHKGTIDYLKFGVIGLYLVQRSRSVTRGRALEFGSLEFGILDLYLVGNLGALEYGI